MKPIFSLSLNNNTESAVNWTYWANPCKDCHTRHYTFGFEDTVKHAKLAHLDSTWADDKTFV